jgi:hypothetical protein
VVSELGLVEVKKSGPVAHFAGVGVCGRVWTCPVCSPKIRQGRAEEIAEAMQAAIAQGFGVEFLTLTLRHHVGQQLAQLLDASTKAWDSTIKSRQLKAVLAQLGYLGFVQVHEVTYGQHGWHPHRHMCLVFKRPLTDKERADLEGDIWRVWNGRLVKRGLSSVRSRGAVLRRCTAAEGLGWYLTKVDRPEGDGVASLGLEMARGDLKTGKGRTPHQLLTDFVETGESIDLHRWREYEQATHGRKLMTWTPGLRRRLLAGAPERTDEELAAAAPEAEVLAELDVRAWREVRAASPGGLAVLEAAEQSRDALVRYLTDVVREGRWWVGKDGWLAA